LTHRGTGDNGERNFPFLFFFLISACSANPAVLRSFALGKDKKEFYTMHRGDKEGLGFRIKTGNGSNGDERRF
jgi:hypothetical protein